jgi:mRNA interferase RelE/StbE
MKPSVSYKLVYTRSAVKDIKSLDSVVRKRLKKKIEVYSVEPVVYSRRLTNSLIGTYRWRIGNYRVVFDIEGDEIVVLSVGHRKEIYR